jgi:hypothetical protein
MHHVTHPQLVGLVEGEAPTVLAGGLLAPLHQAVTREQTVDGGWSQRQVGGDLRALAYLGDHGFD